MKKIEVNLGVGLNMFFPETIVIEIDDTIKNVTQKKQGRKPSKSITEIEVRKEI